MTTNLQPLENLIKSGGLKREPPDQQEFDGLVSSARRQLRDADVEGLSDEGRFSFLYGAAHALGVAALRWHGYRSGKRYLVFQSLQHTANFEASQWRVLNACHRQRNLAEYEGHFEVSSQLLAELAEVTQDLLARVEAFGPVP